MLARKWLSNDETDVDIPKEALPYYDAIADNLGKLANASGMAWDFGTSDSTDAALRISFAEGALTAVLAAGTLYFVRKFIQKRKKTDAPKEET